MQGRLESQLTPRGVSQAVELGSWMATAEPTIGRVAVSPKLRTRETLEAIGSEHSAVVAAPTAVRSGLREIELTGWEGKARSKITAASVATVRQPRARPRHAVDGTGILI